MFTSRHILLWPIGGAIAFAVLFADPALSDGPYRAGSAHGYSNADHMRGRSAGPDLPAPCAGVRRGGPDYVAGVDASGNPVYPAETRRSRQSGDPVPEPYFQIVRPMPPGSGAPRRAAVGEVAVNVETGQTTFNGVPLDGDDQIASGCGN